MFYLLKLDDASKAADKANAYDPTAWRKQCYHSSGSRH